MFWKTKILKTIWLLVELFLIPPTFGKTPPPNTPSPPSWSEHNRIQPPNPLTPDPLLDQFQELGPVPLITYHPSLAPLALALTAENLSATIPTPLTSAGLSSTLTGILHNYDKRIRPDFYGPPKNVSITINVKSLSAVSEVDMEFDIDFYLRQYWQDERLSYDHTENNISVSMIGLTHQFSKEIWHPDTFFPNEKRSYIHSATVTNEFIRLWSDGKILKSTRLTLTASCPMNLMYFPMDQQICAVELGSYGFSKKDLEYIWKEGEKPVRMGWNADTLPQFKVFGHREKNRTSMTSTGHYSILIVEFLFVRSLNYYLIQFYIPAALIVVISWFSLWMGREAAAERMALGVTTVLTITTLLLSTNANSPKISYVKAIDIYLGICFTMVFASLLQSASIGYMAKRIKVAETLKDEMEDKKQAWKHELAEEVEKKTAEGGSEEVVNPFQMIHLGFKRDRVMDKELEAAAAKVRQSKFGLAFIDVISRIAFPLGFFLFNLGYWSYYLSASQIVDEGSWITH